MSANELLRVLREQSNPRKALELQRFFKTGAGDYAQGDIFLGITVPISRKLAADYLDLSLAELKKLMRSPFHEARFSALVILITKYKRSKVHEEKRRYFDFYMDQLGNGRINNWDLVDVSAPTIGEFLIGEKGTRALLHAMTRDKNVWVRRSSILFTFASLRIRETKPTLDISTKLLHDDHDLIHKAVGWALREVGKINPTELRKYLEKHGRKMSRTTLRYAIEKFSASERRKWLEITR